METEERINELVAMLAELSPGYYPLPIFQQLARLTATPIVEIVPVRKRAGCVEVLLLDREPNDPLFAGMVHTPGTVVRPNDTPGSFDDAIGRIMHEELADLKVSQPVFVKTISHHSGRGMEVAQVYWVEVLGSPKAGEFYASDQLPATLIPSQFAFIPLAVEHYQHFSAE